MQVSALVRTIEIPLEARFAKGLKQLRETLYFKGVTFNALFAQLQNGACWFVLCDFALFCVRACVAVVAPQVLTLVCVTLLPCRQHDDCRGRRCSSAQ